MKTAIEIPLAATDFNGDARAWRLDPPLKADPVAPLSTVVPPAVLCAALGFPMGTEPGPEYTEIVTVSATYGIDRTIGIAMRGEETELTIYHSATSMYDRALGNGTRIEETPDGPIAYPDPATDGVAGGALEYLASLGYSVTDELTAVGELAS